MRIAILLGSAVLGAGFGFLAGGAIGAVTNDSHDDLGIGEGLSILFGGLIGAGIGATAAVITAAELTA